MVSLGFCPGKRRRVGYDTYMLYNNHTGESIKSEQFTEDEPEEVRMLDIQNTAASVFQCSTALIEIRKELDARSGECKVFLSQAGLAVGCSGG